MTGTVRGLGALLALGVAGFTVSTLPGVRPSVSGPLSRPVAR